LLRLRGWAVVLGIVVLLMALGLGVVELVSLPFGGVGIAGGLLLGLVVVTAALGILALFGRRRQRRMQKERSSAAAERAATSRRR